MYQGMERDLVETCSVVRDCRVAERGRVPAIGVRSGEISDAEFAHCKAAPSQVYTGRAFPKKIKRGLRVTQLPSRMRLQVAHSTGIGIFRFLRGTAQPRLPVPQAALISGSAWFSRGRRRRLGGKLAWRRLERSRPAS